MDRRLLTSYDPEELIRCSYDKSHAILRKNLWKHYLKCEKRNSHIKLLICPGSYTHRLKPSEFVHHLQECKEYFNYIQTMEQVNKYQPR